MILPDNGAIEPCVGLALGSGGSRGLAHVGVIKVLRASHITISSIAGSSAGALVGGLYALYSDIAAVEQALLSPNWKDIAKILFDFSLSGGVVKGRRLREFVQYHFGTKKFEDLHIPFCAVSTNLKTAQKIMFRTGKVASAVMASMAVPFVFPPVKIKNVYCIDGGVVEPVPVATARLLGAQVVVAVNLDGKQLIKLKKTPSLPHSVMQQAVNIYRYNLSQLNVALADVVVEPNTGVTGIVGWKGFLQSKNIVKSGETAMRLALPKLTTKIDLHKTHLV